MLELAKNKPLVFLKMLEKARFLGTCIQSWQKICIIAQIFLLQNQYVYKKLQNFVTISKLMMPA